MHCQSLRKVPAWETYLDPRQKSYEDLAALGLAHRLYNLGDIFEENRLHVGLLEGLNLCRNDANGELTTKSSSSFLPFFFLLPFRPSVSTSSVIPRAGSIHELKTPSAT